MLRAPRLRLLANGVALDGAIDAEVSSNNHFAADHFHVRLSSDLAAAELLEAADIMLDVQVSLDGDDGDFASLVQGQVDSLEFDPVAGVLQLAGRDLAARLIDSRTQETFANQTAGEIASALAGRHDLAADVAPTTTPVGRYWQLEHDRIQLNEFARATTEWDLLVTLAQFEGFDVWVRGATLHFRPAEIGPVTVLRAAATMGGAANVVSLHLHRALTLAQDIEVTVKSWNSRQAVAFTRTARRKGGGRSQRLVYVVPNLTPDDALKLAQRRLAQLSRHERVLTAEMPGELDMAPRGGLRLEATGSGFDRDYVIDRIDRHISIAHGFTQTVHARNPVEVA